MQRLFLSILVLLHHSGLHAAKPKISGTLGVVGLKLPLPLGLRGGGPGSGQGFVNREGRCALQALLFAAVDDDDPEGVHVALQGGANANEPNFAMAGMTALHHAASKGSVGCVQALLSRGARASAKSESGTVPLHLAAEGGHTAIIQALLEAGADVNEDCLPGCSWTPIFFACAHGHYEASKLLVESGARLLIRDEEGNSPAEVAERWRERPRDLRAQTDVFDATESKGANDRMRLVKMLARVSNQEPRSVYEQSVEGAHTDDDEFGPGAEDENNFEDEECLGKTEQGCASHVPLTEREIEGTLYELRLGTPESKVKAAGRCSSSSNMFEVLTHEGETLCFKVSSRGFRLVSRSEGSEHLGGYFETLHTCLIRVSQEYNRMFMEELSQAAKEATFNRATEPDSDVEVPEGAPPPYTKDELVTGDTSQQPSAIKMGPPPDALPDSTSSDLD